MNAFNEVDQPGSGVVQILEQKELIYSKGKKVTRILLSDGEHMTWLGIPKYKSVKQELEILPDFSILKLVNIDVRKSRIIIINDFELINDNVKENVAKTKLDEITREFLANVQQEKILVMIKR